MSIEIPPILQQYLQAAWGNLDPAAAAELLHPQYRRHLSPTLEPIDREGQVRRIAAFQAGFGQIRLSINDVIVEGDRFAFRSTLQAVHSGEFAGIEPTGVEITVGLIDIMRVQDGLIAEQWGGPDMHDLLWQVTGGSSIV